MTEAPAVWLIDVPAAHEAAFASWADEHGLQLVATGADDFSPAFSRPVSMCILAVRHEADVAADRIGPLAKQLRGAPLVVLAANLGIDTVVRLMRSVATDVIELSNEPRDVVARACSHYPEPSGSAEIEDFVGQSEPMRDVREQLRAVAPTLSTVLLTGETGSGKGLAARVLHNLSSRADEPFIHVDCPSLSPTVIESELFGHERGAFTGAQERRSGRFELAARGTIFLDEIGDLEPPMQAKLLRVIQDREYERVGGSHTQIMSARLVAATNRDLRRGVELGRFRADLYFRLKVFHVELPPLRERSSDVPLLVRRSVEKLASRLQVPVPRISDGFYEALTDYHWPGNVRELMNLLERVLIERQGGTLDEGTLEGLFEPEEGLDESGIRERRALHDARAADRRRVADALVAARGNVARAGRALGVPRTTLRYQIKQLGLEHLVASPFTRS